jgi:hypothetical protein
LHLTKVRLWGLFLTIPCQIPLMMGEIMLK